MVDVYLSLGSNLGNRVLNINKAISLLKANPDIFCVESSKLYETAPQGVVNQDHFINCAVSLSTTLNPQSLLRVCKNIEKKLKRVHLFRWGPRVIDLDILIYGNEEINTENLTIPHPRMYERAFVLIPLSELNPSFLEFVPKVRDQEVKIHTQLP